MVLNFELQHFPVRQLAGPDRSGNLPDPIDLKHNFSRSDGQKSCLLSVIRVYQSMPEYVRVCQSRPEYARVCQSVPEYDRVLPSFAKVVPKSSPSHPQVVPR